MFVRVQRMPSRRFISKCECECDHKIFLCLLTVTTRSLDPEQAPALIDIIQNLLKDTSTMVLGSALFAFQQVCPTRFDLLHGHFRKLCQMLADIDEWGQITALGLLTRYARTQFLHPDGPDGANANSPLPEKPFYEDEEEDRK